MTDFHKAEAEKTYKAIGRFMFEFSQAEYAIRHYLAVEINLGDEYFDAIVGIFSVSTLCNVAKEVFTKSRSETNGKAIKKLLDQFYELSGNRNRVAHGLWVPFKDGGTVHHVPHTKPVNHVHANQAISLETLADDACKLRAKLEHEFSSPSLPES